LKFFFSGASGIRASVLPEVAAVLKWRLLSMHDSFKGNTKVWTAISHHPDCAMEECMLDSGAFTAYTKGKKVILDDLMRVYDDTMSKLHPKVQVWLINLDVVIDERWTKAEVDAALAQGDKNYKILKKRYGERVLPVFHAGEGEARLREIASMNDYIAAGFNQRLPEKFRIAQAEGVLPIAHALKKQVHGLATTGYSMLSRTNFDSVDSASWLYAAAMGKVLMITEKGTIAPLTISAQSPIQKDYRAHYNSLPAEEQQYILKRLKAAKVTLEQVQNDLSYRILFTAKELTEWLERRQRAVPRSSGSLFGL
jgi:hypothetical protein